MRDRKIARKSDATNVVAGAAGGGIGTVVAAVANGMPDGAPYKSLLTVSAPLLAIGISGLWLFLKAVYIDPYANRKKYVAADAEMERILADARTYAEGVLNNQNSSDAHRKEVIKMLEELGKTRLKKIIERMEIITN